MEDPKKPDGTGLPNPEAPAEGVKTPAETPDYEAVLLDKDQRIARLTTDRDNYRTGMLKYKKLSEADPDDKSLDEERVKQMIREEMINSEIGKEQAEKDAIIAVIAKENKELKKAIQNKSQISNLPGGSSQPENDLTVEKLTDEQKAYFDNLSKEIGVKIDPNKFLENWNKIKSKK